MYFFDKYCSKAHSKIFESQLSNTLHHFTLTHHLSYHPSPRLKESEGVSLQIESIDIIIY